MKKFTLLKNTILLFCILLTAKSASAEITHGSIKGTNATLYAQGNAGGDETTPQTGATLDYKVVTKGSKSWVFLQFNGTSGINTGAAWQTQLRYWSSTNAKTENNLVGAKDATAKTVLGTATTTIPDPLNISFFQDLSVGGFSETLLISYDITAKNSPVAGDNTAPVVTACTAVPTETDAELTITGSDNSGDVFFHISDAANGVEEFALSGTFKLTGLSASTTYNLTITPIDFNGNEGTPLQKSFTTTGLVQIMYGVAKEIKFRFKSTATQFEYYYEFTDPSKKFRDAFLKITPAGGSEIEIKPTISPDSTSAYGITTDASIANKVLTLNCGYFIYAPGDPVWDDYVVDNTMITEGVLNGTPIKHKMGEAINPTQYETTPPALSSVQLIDATANQVKLNLSGSDNSGALYYTITGAEEEVHAFRTGDYYLTAVKPGNVYTLNITANDFSGNASTPTEQKVKTMKARTNLLDGDLMKYNSTLISPTGALNELAAKIQVSGNTLTIGCNTTNTGLAGTQLNRKFFNASVTINGTSYPLTLAVPDSTSAETTFTDFAGDTPITEGSSLSVQFSIFWTQNAGNFFTGNFAYTIGDNGQEDTEGPSTPALYMNGDILTWEACTDMLSGVKYYLVKENGQTEVTIFDLGEASFSYTMANSSNSVEVTAVDFVGNETKTSEILSGVNPATNNVYSVYPNPATDRINFNRTVKNATIYSIQGQQLLSGNETDRLDVSGLAEGLYIVRLTSQEGTTMSVKLKIE